MRHMSDVGNVNMYAPYALNLLETDEDAVHHIAIRRNHARHIAAYGKLKRGIREWYNLRRTLNNNYIMDLSDMPSDIFH